MASTSGDDKSGDPQTSGELESADLFRRAKATLRLGRYADPQALDRLLALLADPDWPVVKAALGVLRRYRDPRIVAAAQAVLRRDDYFRTFTRGGAIGTAATRALRSQGEEGFQALLTLLSEFQDGEIRGQSVVRQLAVLRDPRAIEPLIACFGSPVFEVANRAAAVMRHFGADAIPPLIAAMGTSDQSVYFQVSWALRWIGAPAVPALLELGRDPRPERRFSAINWLKMAYSHSHDPRIVEFLFEATQEKPASSAAWMRYQSALALAKCGDPRSIEPLLEILQNAASHPVMQYSAVRPLGQLGDEGVLEALTAAYEASMAGEDGVEAGERAGQRYEFQDALLHAMAKMHARLGITRADADPSGASTTT